MCRPERSGTHSTLDRICTASVQRKEGSVHIHKIVDRHRPKCDQSREIKCRSDSDHQREICAVQAKRLCSICAVFEQYLIRQSICVVFVHRLTFVHQECAIRATLIGKKWLTEKKEVRKTTKVQMWFNQMIMYLFKFNLLKVGAILS